MKASIRGTHGLAGHLVLVTGGARGIGAGITEVVAEAGATVVIADIDAAGAREQAAALEQAGCRAGHVRIDLADEASIVRGSEFSIPYVAWGLEDPSVFLLRVAEEVRVRVELSGTLAPGPTPAAP